MSIKFNACIKLDSWSVFITSHHKQSDIFVNLHGILAGPLSCCTIVSLSVSLEQLCNIRYKWIIWIRISQKGANAQKNLGNGQSRTPLVLENIKTNSSIGVDVTVIDTGSEMYLWRFEWIICWEVNIKEENSSRVWGVIWSHDCSLPVEHIISDWSSGTVRWRVFS